MNPKLLSYAGAALAVVALVGLVLWQANSLMKKGVELGQAKGRIEKLNEEVKRAESWKVQTLRLLDEQRASLEEWQTTASSFEIAYQEALARQPRVIYRDVAATVEDAIPVGNCDAAAVASWHLLKEAGLVEGVPP